MSLQYRWNYLSGRYQTDLTRQWQVGSLQGTVDPTIPSLPLNSPSSLSASLAVTETADAVAIAADVSGGTITASLAVTETSDAVAITGANRTTASLAVTETSDAVAITGSNRTVVTLAVTETSDAVAITGSNRTTATLAVTETADTVAITGTNRTTATLAATETADTVAINGANVTPASLAATETSDSIAINADVLGGAITVTLAATETSDSVSLAVLDAQDQPISGGGSAWKGPAEPKYRVHPEYEDRPKKKRKREKVGEQVILAGEPEIQTGIIEVTPARDALGKLQQARDEADRIRRAKLRAIALADDEWLMVA